MVDPPMSQLALGFGPCITRSRSAALLWLAAEGMDSKRQPPSPCARRMAFCGVDWRLSAAVSCILDCGQQCCAEMGPFGLLLAPGLVPMEDRLQR